MDNSGLNSHYNADTSLQKYYYSLESRIGYRLMLGGTRHFGYWEKDTNWPFPITPSLRRMEDHLFESLKLGKDAEVLDAGCGVGHVAINMMRKGLKVQCIDLVDHHIEKAKRNVKSEGLQNFIPIRKGDYHNLNFIADASLGGIYTMETFVHATDPKTALAEFFRVLQPGGRIALYEYDHIDTSKASKEYRDSMEIVNKYAAMPANQGFERGVLESLVEEVGFEDVKLEDLSVNIRPMLRLFFVLAFVPYLVVVFFGLERWFINTVAAVQGYRGRNMWRYIVVTARKPHNSQ